MADTLATLAPEWFTSTSSTLFHPLASGTIGALIVGLFMWSNRVDHTRQTIPALFISILPACLLLIATRLDVGVDALVANYGSPSTSSSSFIDLPTGLQHAVQILADTYGAIDGDGNMMHNTHALVQVTLAFMIASRVSFFFAHVLNVLATTNIQLSKPTALIETLDTCLAASACYIHWFVRAPLALSLHSSLQQVSGTGRQLRPWEQAAVALQHEAIVPWNHTFTLLATGLVILPIIGYVAGRRDSTSVAPIARSTVPKHTTEVQERAEARAQDPAFIMINTQALGGRTERNGAVAVLLEVPEAEKVESPLNNNNSGAGVAIPSSVGAAGALPQAHDVVVSCDTNFGIRMAFTHESVNGTHGADNSNPTTPIAAVDNDDDQESRSDSCNGSSTTSSTSTTDAIDCDAEVAAYMRPSVREHNATLFDIRTESRDVFCTGAIVDGSDDAVAISDGVGFVGLSGPAIASTSATDMHDSCFFGGECDCFDHSLFAQEATSNVHTDDIAEAVQLEVAKNFSQRDLNMEEPAAPVDLVYEEGDEGEGNDDEEEDDIDLVVASTVAACIEASVRTPMPRETRACEDYVNNVDGICTDTTTTSTTIAAGIDSTVTDVKALNTPSDHDGVQEVIACMDSDEDNTTAASDTSSSNLGIGSNTDPVPNFVNVDGRTSQNILSDTSLTPEILNDKDGSQPPQGSNLSGFARMESNAISQADHKKMSTCDTFKDTSDTTVIDELSENVGNQQAKSADMASYDTIVAVVKSPPLFFSYVRSTHATRLCYYAISATTEEEEEEEEEEEKKTQQQQAAVVRTATSVTTTQAETATVLPPSSAISSETTAPVVTATMKTTVTVSDDNKRVSAGDNHNLHKKLDSIDRAHEVNEDSVPVQSDIQMDQASWRSCVDSSTSATLNSTSNSPATTGSDNDAAIHTHDYENTNNNEGKYEDDDDATAEVSSEELLELLADSPKPNPFTPFRPPMSPRMKKHGNHTVTAVRNVNRWWTRQSTPDGSGAVVTHGSGRVGSPFKQPLWRHVDACGKHERSTAGAKTLISASSPVASIDKASSMLPDISLAADAPVATSHSKTVSIASAFSSNETNFQVCEQDSLQKELGTKVDIRFEQDVKSRNTDDILKAAEPNQKQKEKKKTLSPPSSTSSHPTQANASGENNTSDFKTREPDGEEKSEGIAQETLIGVAAAAAACVLFVGGARRFLRR